MLLYPLVRYSIYAALAMMAGDVDAIPVVAWGNHDGDCSGRDDCGAKRAGAVNNVAVAVDQECGFTWCCRRAGYCPKDRFLTIKRSDDKEDGLARTM